MLLTKLLRINQQWLLAMCALLGGLNASATENQLKYKVLLDNKEIGFHQFELNELDGVKTVTSDAQFEVKVLFITAFKYRHSSFEQWQDDCVQIVESSTLSNGKKASLKGSSTADQFELIGEDTKNGFREQQLQGCIKTFAYWNSSILDESTLLNTQTGDYVDVTVSNLGNEQIQVDQQSKAAIKYRITSNKEYAGQIVDITLWYSADEMQWLALEAPAKGNRTLRYEALNTNHSSS